MASVGMTTANHPQAALSVIRSSAAAEDEEVATHLWQICEAK